MFKKEYAMHEWLSGGVSPCQGEGRGFESRLVLSMIQKRRYPMDISFFVCSNPAGLERFEFLRSTPVVAGKGLVFYFFIGYAMHSSGKNSLAAGRYFHYFAWLVAFTNFSQKISTQLLTWLIISVILQTEQRKKKRNQKGYKKSRRFPEIF